MPAPRSGMSRGSKRSGPGSRSRFGGKRGAGGRGGSRNADGPNDRKPRFFRKKVSRLSIDRIRHVDYKNVELLLKFMTEKGKILPQRITGNNTKQQRMVSNAIKRARHAGLVPYVTGKV